MVRSGYMISIVLSVLTLSCAQAGTGEGAAQEDGMAPARDSMVYVTGIEFPDGYDWSGAEGQEDGDAEAIVFMMAEGKRVLEFPAGKGHPVSSDASRHWWADRHLYTYSADGTDTVVLKDGRELFRYSGKDRIVSLVVVDGDVITLDVKESDAGMAGLSEETVPDGNICGVCLRENGMPVYETGCSGLISRLHEDEGSMCFSFIKDGKLFICRDGTVSGIDMAFQTDSVLLAEMSCGKELCIARIRGSRDFAVQYGGKVHELDMFRYDCLDRCRVFRMRDTPVIYGEMNYSYDRLCSPAIWTVDGEVLYSFDRYSRAFSTLVHRDDIYVFEGYQEYSPAINCYRNGEKIYSYGRGLDVSAEPAAAVHDGQLYFLFAGKHRPRTPYMAVDDGIMEYDFNGFFTGIYVW